MKHILNNLSEEEKNAIREQHAGGMKIELGKFKQMVETKLGDPKPYLSEQLIKRRVDKIDARTNKQWQQLKNSLMAMGFKLTTSRDESEASPSPIDLIYQEVGQTDVMSLQKNGYTVNVQWPSGASDAGTIEPSEVRIDIYNDKNRPTFAGLSRSILDAAKLGPGLGRQNYEGGIPRIESDFLQFAIPTEPYKFATFMGKLVSMLK